MLFFILITVGIYISNSNKGLNQDKQISKVEKNYNTSVEEINKIYEKALGVPIPDGFVISQIPEEQDINNGLVIYKIPETERQNVDWTTKDSRRSI